MTIEDGSLRIDDESDTLSLAIFPESEVGIKIDGLKYAESLALITLVNFSIIDAVQLVHSDAFKLGKGLLFWRFYNLRVGLDDFLFVAGEHGLL